jgi:hypothetical protein
MTFLSRYCPPLIRDPLFMGLQAIRLFFLAAQINFANIILK